MDIFDKGKNPKSKKVFEKHMLRHMLSTFLLWMISKGSVHGYELIKRLECEGGVRVITPSNLYPILKAMTKSGLITQVKELKGKRERKVYSITPAGKIALLKIKKHMQSKPLKRAFMREMVG